MVIDILSPVGGRCGGIENVIRAWTKNLPRELYDVRVIHMSSGIKYLEGYDRAYAFDACEEVDINARLTHFTRNYAGFINLYGKPDICVAVNWPAMCVVADAVKRLLKLNFRIVSWVHSSIDEYEQSGFGSVREMLMADAHICISRSNERRIKELCPDAVTYYVGNPVNMQEFIEKPIDNNTLCYVGRLQDVKRVDVILEALYRARHKWKFKIVGSGESEDELKEIAAYLKQQDQVQFLGWKDSPWEYCKDASALVCASEYEGFMLTGAEALSMGMTVISTPVDGVIDYVRHGENGYFFKNEDAIGLAHLLDEIYEGKVKLCDRIDCRKSVEMYNIDNYFDNIKRILEDMR